MKQSLFRSIRISLIKEGKLFRYLAYAIGEIVLIILGILFALQISDWNEDRKEQTTFDLYIVQLKEDAVTAIENASEAIEWADTFESEFGATLKLLKISELDADQLEVFERGLNNFGKYPELSVQVGLLGRLLNDDIEQIGRDPEVGRKSMEMASMVFSRFEILNPCRQSDRLNFRELSQVPRARDWFGRNSYDL